MDALAVLESIKSKNQKFIEHKVKILEERVYWMCIDKIYEAQEYADYEIDNNNNIFITYSLKKDESIIENAQDYIITEIIYNYRRNIKFKLTKDHYYVLFKDDEIIIYLTEPTKIKLSNSESDSESDSELRVRNMMSSYINSDRNMNIYEEKETTNKIEFGTIIN
jgi:hypothetical protein